ncbi:MAG: fibrobacter succinogenes major paralogous domain-containing protein [Bacteroidales bacterium]|nr:fibrobacter succinogenes major paralogous domain-containing protein [Bacteroidales bacterium]
MKKIVLLFLMMVMSMTIMAQSNVITYQAVVRDANNRLVTNEAITLTIQVLDISDNIMYSETDNVNSNANGLISTFIGDNDPTAFAAINWNNAKFKTTTKVVSSGYEVETTQPVNSVPFAIYSSDVSPSGATITAVYGKIQADSLALAQRITVDSIALHKATKDTAVAIRTALTDTAKAIRDSIGDGTLTITYGTETLTFTANQKTPGSITIPAQTSANNGEITITRNGASIPNGTFTVNQIPDQTIDIEVPTKLSDLPNDGGHYAKRDSVNVFTADNDFTGGSITVPSKFDIHNPPTAATCTEDAVNICDLVAVFDSLMRRVDSLADVMKATQQELDEIKTVVMPTLNLSSNKPLDISASDGETVEVKYTAVISNTGKTFSYSWYVNGAVQESDSNKLILTTNTSTTFKVLCVATSGAIVLKDSMTTTICISPSMEYVVVGGNSTDFGKVNIISSTATTASWRDENGVEVGTWNSGLTDILPVGEYTVVLSSSGGCDLNLSIKVTSSPLCPVSSLNANCEVGVNVNGHDYVTKVKEQGHWYNVVDIDGVCWTRENMRSSQYYDANSASYVSIVDASTTMYSDVNNTAYFYNPYSPADSVKGYLYNWVAAIGKAADNMIQDDKNDHTRGICPEGWHVPSYNEADSLRTKYNAGMLAGTLPGQTESWSPCSPDDSTPYPCNHDYVKRNSTGYSAVLAGIMYWNDSNYYYDGAYFWVGQRYGSSTSNYARCYILYEDSSTVNFGVISKRHGMSVRCVRD